MTLEEERMFFEDLLGEPIEKEPIEDILPRMSSLNVISNDFGVFADELPEVELKGKGE